MNILLFKKHKFTISLIFSNMLTEHLHYHSDHGYLLLYIYSINQTRQINISLTLTSVKIPRRTNHGDSRKYSVLKTSSYVSFIQITVYNNI